MAQNLGLGFSHAGEREQFVRFLCLFLFYNTTYSVAIQKLRGKIVKLIRILCLPLLIKQEEQPKCKYCANIVQILCKYCTNIIQIFFESNRAIHEYKRLNRAKCYPLNHPLCETGMCKTSFCMLRLRLRLSVPSL